MAFKFNKQCFLDFTCFHLEHPHLGLVRLIHHRVTEELQIIRPGRFRQKASTKTGKPKQTKTSMEFHIFYGKKKVAFFLKSTSFFSNFRSKLRRSCRAAPSYGWRRRSRTSCRGRATARRSRGSGNLGGRWGPGGFQTSKWWVVNRGVKH